MIFIFPIRWDKFSLVIRKILSHLQTGIPPSARRDLPYPAGWLVSYNLNTNLIFLLYALTKGTQVSFRLVGPKKCIVESKKWQFRNTGWNQLGCVTTGTQLAWEETDSSAFSMKCNC